VGNREDKYNTIHINDRLSDKLSMIPDYPVVVIDAPAGYGKTTAIREYAQTSTVRFIWINVSNPSRDIFWSDFCDAFLAVNKDAQKLLKTLDYPQSEKTVAEVRSIIKHVAVTEPTCIVIDNCHLITDEFHNLFISSIPYILPDDLHFIFISQTAPPNTLAELIGKKLVLHISKEDFELTAEDIVIFFDKNHIHISEKDSIALREFSDGWISAIYLQMIDYVQNKRLNNYATIDTLVEETIWDRINARERDFLVGLSKLEHFTLREAKYMAPNGYNENQVENFLSKLVFVRFDKSYRSYYIHHIFLNYLHKKFELLPADRQQQIVTKMGRLYQHNGDIFDAYKYFYNAGQWDLIYSSTPTFEAIYPYIKPCNKDFFMELITNCPEDMSISYYYFATVMCLVLFMYNEKSRLVDYLMNIVYSVEGNETVTDREKHNLMGTVYFIRGYTQFNNIEIMHSFYKKALEYSNAPVNTPTSRIPFTFGCPSMFHLYHRCDGDADTEIRQTDVLMSDYYKLAENHGKGAEALFKAEVLYNRGDVNDAEILCHKVLYMADGAEQSCIILGVLLLLTRKCIFDGDYDTYKRNMSNFKNKIKYHNNGMDAEYVNMADMCESYMHMLMNDCDSVTEWLTDYNTIRSRMNYISITYANIIYAMYLCISEKYYNFLGISGQMLEAADVINSAQAKIYIYMYISYANFKLGNRTKAFKIMSEAINLAMPGMFIIPFVENYMNIECILKEWNYDSIYSDFIDKVKSLAKKYMASYKSITRKAGNNDNYGLTARELDVAKLAAQRYSNKQIAEQLFIAESTVKSNLKVIFSKLGISSRNELAKYFQ